MNDLEIYLAEENPGLSEERAMRLLHDRGIVPREMAAPGEVTGSHAPTAAMWLRANAAAPDRDQTTLF